MKLLFKVDRAGVKIAWFIMKLMRKLGYRKDVKMALYYVLIVAGSLAGIMINKGFTLGLSIIIFVWLWWFPVKERHPYETWFVRLILLMYLPLDVLRTNPIDLFMNTMLLLSYYTLCVNEVPPVEEKVSRQVPSFT